MKHLILAWPEINLQKAGIDEMWNDQIYAEYGTQCRDIQRSCKIQNLLVCDYKNKDYNNNMQC